jgi:hypothetical protein
LWREDRLDTGDQTAGLTEQAAACSGVHQDIHILFVKEA